MCFTLSRSTSSIHNWVLFLLWLHLFILSGVTSPLISSSILGTYQPGEFIFQCPIFLPFHTDHGVLKARILKWFAIPFSSGPCFVRTCHHYPSIQLWMWLVMEVNSNAVKSNTAQEPGMLGPWIKANWKWSNKKWQEWTSTF